MQLYLDDLEKRQKFVQENIRKLLEMDDESYSNTLESRLMLGQQETVLNVLKKIFYSNRDVK